jgi:hypothetical protein
MLEDRIERDDMIGNNEKINFKIKLNLGESFLKKVGEWG